MTDLSTKQGTFLNMNYTDVIGDEGAYKNGVFVLTVMAHKDLFKTGYGKTRVDLIIEELDGLFNKARGFGIGELKFERMTMVVFNTNFSGCQLKYRPVDFGNIKSVTN